MAKGETKPKQLDSRTMDTHFHFIWIIRLSLVIQKIKVIPMMMALCLVITSSYMFFREDILKNGVWFCFIFYLFKMAKGARGG